MKVTEWIKDIEDEDLALFAWFCDRTAKLHGYEYYYTIHIDDVVRIINKRNKGLLDWILSHKNFTDWVTVGHLYDTVYTFKVRPVEIPKQREPGRPRTERFFNYPLTKYRSELMYMYLLGCLNTNFLEDDISNLKPWRLNAFGIHEFNLDRGAINYIKKKDRQ